MPSDPYAQPLGSRIFDYSVVAAGVALALVATGLALSSLGAPAWGYWLAVPVIALVERYPMTLFVRTAAVQIPFSSCVVAFLSILVDVSTAIMIWSAGVLLAQAVSRVRWPARIFNFGVGLTSGGIGFLVIDATRGSADVVSPRALAAVTVGCAVMFLVDYLLSEVSVAFEEGSSVPTELVTRDMAVAMGGVVTVNSVGYLGAIVQRELPQWCLALLAVPVAALLIASNSRDVALESSRRLRVMFATAGRMQRAETREDVLHHVREALQELARGSQADLRTDPPQPGEIGEPLDDGVDRHWLVTSGLWRAHPDPVLDSQHLRSLARMATEALTRVRMREVVTKLAESDPLTGLCNRSVFLQRMDDALASCRSSLSPCLVAVLFCDLDGFKKVNDWFGHAAGDQLLVDVARSLERTLGADALVARLGGDEFAILIRRLPSGDDLERWTEAVLAAVERRFEYDGRSVLVSTSLGAALSEDPTRPTSCCATPTWPCTPPSSPARTAP